MPDNKDKKNRAIVLGKKEKPKRVEKRIVICPITGKICPVIQCLVTNQAMNNRGYDGETHCELSQGGSSA